MATVAGCASENRDPATPTKNCRRNSRPPPTSKLGPLPAVISVVISLRSGGSTMTVDRESVVVAGWSDRR